MTADMCIYIYTYIHTYKHTYTQDCAGASRRASCFAASRLKKHSTFFSDFCSVDPGGSGEKLSLLEAIVVLSGAWLGPLGGLEPVRGLCGSPWGLSATVLELPLAVLGVSCVDLGPSWTVVGAFRARLEQLGGVLVRV